ncbi:transposase-like protein DUF772 [Paraburkholderia sp. BL8N3]|nr:transposase-like protein DUF772 [Paraburkholderia sp. BL8N3]
MTQLHLGLNLSTKRTRKREFLDDTRRVVPWSRPISLIEPHYPEGKTGRPPFPVVTMLHIHFIHQWIGLLDPAVEEALYDVPLYREFAGLDGGTTRRPDETTILRFRHLLKTLYRRVPDVSAAHALAGKICKLLPQCKRQKSRRFSRHSMHPHGENPVVRYVCLC